MAHINLIELAYEKSNRMRRQESSSLSLSLELVKIAKTKIDTLKESKKLLRGARDVLSERGDKVRREGERVWRYGVNKS